MKILFDTNVLIASFLSNGSCYDIVQSAVNAHEVFYTQYVLKEFQRNFKAKFKFSTSIIHSMTIFIEKHFHEGIIGKDIPDFCRDKDDNHILADAEANGIDVIIIGDKDLLVLINHLNNGSGMRLALFAALRTRANSKTIFCRLSLSSAFVMCLMMK